ncbi:MAG: HAMP domain-containing protein [Chloroflexi bacterium]|nr:HAMP domain-containing protein [Chloroflexota bacterium]
MMPETTDSPPRRGHRLLRGLRAQLLLWTILPLAVVLVALSLAGVTRHRQAMTRMVEDRDRGLATAEANRLGREIAQQTATLTRLAATLPALAAPSAAFSLPDGVTGGAGEGLALLDARGRLLAASPAAGGWSNAPLSAILAARTAAVGSPQYETDLTGAEAARLLIAVPAGDKAALIAALPVETLDLSASSLMMEGEAQGVMLVLDRTGRRVHHHDPRGLIPDASIFADLPATGSGSTYLRDRLGRELLVSYAQVEPPGWTLITAEDVRAITAMGMSVVEVLPLLLLFVAVVALLAVSLGVINVVRPLQELDRRAGRVAWGDFDAVAQPVGGVQEIDDLRATLAQMAARIRAYQAGMRDYLTAITQGQEAERSRLAHELHDVAIQGLIALKQRGQMASKALAHDPARASARLQELTGLIDEEIVSLRRIIGDLRPIYLEDLGFVPALEMLARQTEARYGLRVHLTVQGQVIRLAPDLELAAYRIAQQALDNVAAHAHAGNAWAEIVFAADSLTLLVCDDGVGFTPPDQPADLARQGHFGLMGMRERALLYGGQLTITSAPGQGAVVTARLPLLH